MPAWPPHPRSSRSSPEARRYLRDGIERTRVPNKDNFPAGLSVPSHSFWKSQTSAFAIQKLRFALLARGSPAHNELKMNLRGSRLEISVLGQGARGTTLALSGERLPKLSDVKYWSCPQRTAPPTRTPRAKPLVSVPRGGGARGGAGAPRPPRPPRRPQKDFNSFISHIWLCLKRVRLPGLPPAPRPLPPSPSAEREPGASPGGLALWGKQRLHLQLYLLKVAPRDKHSSPRSLCLAAWPLLGLLRVPGCLSVPPAQRKDQGRGLEEPWAPRKIGIPTLIPYPWANSSPWFKKIKAVLWLGKCPGDEHPVRIQPSHQHGAAARGSGLILTRPI